MELPMDSNFPIQYKDNGIKKLGVKGDLRGFLLLWSGFFWD